MKKFIIFLIVFFLSLTTFTYIFSLKSNMSFENTILHFQNIGREIFGLTNSNIATNTNPSHNNSTIITSSNSHYYYDQLNDTGKTIYDSLEKNINNLKKGNYSIDFSTKFNDLLNKSGGKYTLNKAFQSAMDAFFYDHPELFYLNLSSFTLNTQSVSIGPLKTYTVQIAPKENSYFHSSFRSEYEVKNAIKRVDDIKKEIIKEISSYNTYDKIKYIHDMLVESIEYDSNYNEKNIYNIYGALVDKKVVCEGYAKTFKYFMDNLDIECILVTGMASNSSGESETHMWNYVKLNDSWYGVDVTWDDPIILGGNNDNNLRHTYFLKGFHTFDESHEPSGRISNSGMLFTLPSLSYSSYR